MISREQLSDDVKTVIEYTPRQGEPMSVYLTRLASQSMCGNGDARAALLGAFDTVSMKLHAEAVAHKFTLH